MTEKSLNLGPLIAMTICKTIQWGDIQKSDEELADFVHDLMADEEFIDSIKQIFREKED